ncbi:MAG: hypothetical protein ACHRHE_07820 [Tepidisphaerales bacterium]
MIAMKMLIVAAGAGVIVLLCAARRTRPVALVLLAALVLAWFYFRLHASVAPAVAVRMSQETTPSPPRAGFQPSADQLRYARVFPSVGEAATQLTARIADTLATLPEGRREPERIAVAAPAEIRPYVVASLRTAFPRAQSNVDSAPTTRPAAAGEFRLRVDVVYEPSINSASGQFVRGGTLTAVGTGAGGTLEDSLAFVDKPWASDAAAAGKVLPGLVVGRAHSPCTSAEEALSQACDAAVEKIRPLLAQGLASSGISDLDANQPWVQARIRAAVHSSRFLQDDFVQEMVRPYSSIYRASVLVSAAPDRIGQLCTQLAAEHYARTARTWNTAGSIGALSLLILLVYLFLNTVTRGYFTLRLRLAAVGLLVAAVFLVIMAS